MSEVVFWSADRGGTRFYRCAEPARGLGLLGHETFVTPVLCESWKRRPTTIVGQRICLAPQVGEWLELAGRPERPRLVYDMDDDYFSTLPGNQPAHDLYSRPDIQEGIQASIAAADLVSVCGPVLADIARRWNPRVVITPNTVPASLLRWPTEARRAVDGLTLGWAGSPGGAADLLTIAPALRRAMVAGHRVHLIGVGQGVAERAGLSGARVTPWVVGTESYLRAIDFDVWLAPYADNPFNRAKFPTKIMEAGALGIPLIASPTGGYLTDQGHVTTVPLTPAGEETPGAWWETLRKLIKSRERRWEMTRAAREAAPQYTTEAGAARWDYLSTSRP